jgi:hypothetical protein
MMPTIAPVDKWCVLVLLVLVEPVPVGPLLGLVSAEVPELTSPLDVVGVLDALAEDSAAPAWI